VRYVTIHFRNGTQQNGTLHNSMLHNSTLLKGTLQNRMQQNGIALQNGTLFKTVCYRMVLLQDGKKSHNGTALPKGT
jgi:hypothetical protein